MTDEEREKRVAPSGAWATSHAGRAADSARASRYVVREQLASGGMGVVFRVLDRVAGAERAMKRARPDAKGDPVFVRALEREYRVLATLDHPRIVRVFDYGVDDLGPYYTMELLAGSDMRRAAPLPAREACAHLRDIATSLALLHARRLLHRDLSPTNVRLTEDGRCKLLDFGALTGFGSSDFIAGTPPMIPPEAFGHGPLDDRSDLYSLGALAYWMLTGRHAFPAQKLDELQDRWRTPPGPPSAFAADVPKELDQLVLALLSADPLARPASAGEVIARLSVIADLPPEGTTETTRLALSFLSCPRFVGRAAALQAVDALLGSTVTGRGGSLSLRAAAGMGRSRLLDEIGQRARLAGAAVVRVDAATTPQTYGTATALVLGVADALPVRARQRAASFRTALSKLGAAVSDRLGVDASAPDADAPADGAILEGWFEGISLGGPLVLLVDDVDSADDASLGLLAGLAMIAPQSRLAVVVTQNAGHPGDPAIGLRTILEHAAKVEVAGLSAPELAELARSIFGRAPGVERFAEWLHERTAGSPLHALEITRQLFARQIIGYSGGVWSLPDHAPDAALPIALGDALAMRVATLSHGARMLAGCLSLQRRQPTFELCASLAGGDEVAGVIGLLNELAARDVLYPGQDGYYFSSAALRDVLVAGMDAVELERNHRRLGEALSSLARPDEPRMWIEAGWHLIEGGDELRGADMIAAVARSGETVRELFANLHRLGRPLEAALRAYGRHHRSPYERLPLLAALAQAGYYEDRAWGERYGDEALYSVEELSGLAAARRLRRFCGGWIALVLGIGIAWLRFRLTPRCERSYPFAQVMRYLFGTVTSLAAVASLSFDVERTERAADVLAPFAVLPKRLTPAGIYAFCRELRQLALETQAEAFETYDALLRRFESPRYYPTLPVEARRFYVAGAHFIRGVLGIFRADGRGALVSADALDRTGLKIYAMIASQLRCLFYTFRGEFAKAAIHREHVELHAAHVGSIWQVETWEAAVLLLVYPQIGDIVGSTRLAHRLELLSRTVPSLKLHAGLAKSGMLLSRRERADRPAIARVLAEYEKHPPRSYAGWAGAMGYIARANNLIGDHAEAKRVCEGALAHVTDADRDYVMHFLTLDLELAVADAALGHGDAALDRLDALATRYGQVDHRLAVGLLHETRACVAWSLGRLEEYEASRIEVERRFLPTREPALVAKCKRLADLGGTPAITPAADSSGSLGDASDTSVSSAAQLARTVVSGRARVG
ncbi:MAG TPA: serine/threonine-protein kinase [Polyangiaceae bacterium]|nr:serine/threonine-protein kinase [Polyangiaceae bacterium]